MYKKGFTCQRLPWLFNFLKLYTFLCLWSFAAIHQIQKRNGDECSSGPYRWFSVGAGCQPSISWMFIYKIVSKSLAKLNRPFRWIFEKQMAVGLPWPSVKNHCSTIFVEQTKKYGVHNQKFNFQEKSFTAAKCNNQQ